MKLLTTNNTKIMKGRDRGYIIAGLHIAPGWTCARSSKGCLFSCLNLSGHGVYEKAQNARARKAKYFRDHTNEFIEQLCQEIEKFKKYAGRKGLTPVFRLNLTSDIPWEVYGVPQRFPELQFYDYSKYHERKPPSNYHLTFSRSESLANHLAAKAWLAKGGNVAVVFKKELPETYWGVPVVSGDEDDLRFLDPSPAIIGLTAKGKGKKDETGFVV